MTADQVLQTEAAGWMAVDRGGSPASYILTTPVSFTVKETIRFVDLIAVESAISQCFIKTRVRLGLFFWFSLSNRGPVLRGPIRALPR